jgi:hypothetical protein
MLKLFQEFNIHVTWATVGLLFFDKKEEVLQNLPSILPHYRHKKYSPIPHVYSIGENEQADPYHYAISLIRLISSYPHQEIASHSFLHYYCLEDGQTLHSFESDLDKSIEVAKKNGFDTKSYVFCRNQKNNLYLPSLLQRGVIGYRGGENHFVYSARDKNNGDSIPRKLIRFLDAYVNITGDHTYNLKKINVSPPYNIPSSRYLRPYSSLLSFLEPFKKRRIKKAMLHAAKHNELFHIWWHPHNFGKNVDQNISTLREILVYYKELHEKYGMISQNMAELSDRLLSNER